MSGNTFGKRFCLTSFGESHGLAMGGIIDGCPSGLALCEEDIQKELDRRKPGQTKFTSQRQESDRIQLLSGVYEGFTTGTAIGFIIHNEDQRARDYDAYKTLFRPGHGDYTYFKKYGHRDHRGGGRASARETVIRVAGGAIAKKYLSTKLNVTVRGYLAQIGELKTTTDFSWQEVEQNSFFCPSKQAVSDIATMIEALRREGDSIGARVNIIVDNVPAGIGEPVFDKLSARLAYALMSIPAVKGIEIGDGFAVINQKGSDHRDEMSTEGFLSNHAGGILAGISNGSSLVISIALKPTSSITTPARSIDIHNEPVQVVVKGRHDPCVGIRAVPVAEAMVALVLADLYLLGVTS